MDLSDLWKEIADYAKEFGVKPDRLFAYKILKQVEKKLNESTGPKSS